MKHDMILFASLSIILQKKDSRRQIKTLHELVLFEVIQFMFYPQILIYHPHFNLIFYVKFFACLKSSRIVKMTTINKSH